MQLPNQPCEPGELMDAVVEQLPAGAQVVVPIANGEPVSLMGKLEARAADLENVRVHQIHIQNVGEGFPSPTLLTAFQLRARQITGAQTHSS